MEINYKYVHSLKSYDEITKKCTSNNYLKMFKILKFTCNFTCVAYKQREEYTVIFQNFEIVL